MLNDMAADNTVECPEMFRANRRIQCTALPNKINFLNTGSINQGIRIIFLSKTLCVQVIDAEHVPAIGTNQSRVRTGADFENFHLAAYMRDNLLGA